MHNIDQAAENEKTFDKKLITLRHELEEDNRIPEHEKLYQKYFQIKTTAKSGTKVTVNQEAVERQSDITAFCPHC